MKKTLLSVAATLIALSSLAQEKQEKKRSTIYGVNLGALITDVTLDAPGVTTKSKTGWGIGVSADTPLSDKFTLFGHINYERKNFDYTASKTFNYQEGPYVATATGTHIYQYVSIPAGFRFYPTNKKNFFINAGGYIDIFYGVKFKESGDYDANLSNSSYHETMFGAIFGGGYRLALSEDNGNDVLFEIRYSKGLSDLLYDAPGKMNTVMIGVSYRVDALDF